LGKVCRSNVGIVGHTRLSSFGTGIPKSIPLQKLTKRRIAKQDNNGNE
jgi:hypothetical protein